ncbi:MULTISPECIES: GGDEF domain-containing protein [Hafnia]|uniref:diguanylate cyclase n=1 Tax=Hafnia alvei ATCC 51873 TaxID=1002364 RepID=G9Y223_HAFAL|nr:MULTISPECIES: GGDEF domain-containing protein [Hafnia]EHM46768.1 diguanylate cyclase domain protein [Hafnia alvei ATCC 51873]OFS10028.1 diguanylate cyclase [Hafnia sp. HMSC23F03]QQE44757.1 GGDEF domain-containing protein [Hafnia alvei]
MNPLQSLDVLYINACVTYASLSVTYFVLSKQNALSATSSLSRRILFGLVAGLISLYLTRSKMYFTSEVYYSFEIVPMLLVTFFGGGIAGITAWFVNFATTGGFVLDNLLLAVMLIPLLLARVWKRNTFRTYLKTIILITLYRIVVVLPFLHTQGNVIDILVYQAVSFLCLLVCYQTLSIKRRSVDAFFKVRAESLRDAMTKVHNRQSLELQLQALSKSRTPCCLVMIDIDNFKLVNDTYGHLAGDQVLVEVAELMNLITRSSDFIARFGGEEFAIIIHHDDLNRAFQICERIRLSISNRKFFLSHGPKIHVTASFGISLYDGKTSTVEETLNRADNALYQAKHSGKNKVVLG